MTDFAHCCVPHCRRRSSKFTREWLCADHWRLVDRRLKVFRTRQLKKLYRAWEHANAICEARLREIAPLAAVDDDLAWSLAMDRSKATRRWYRAEKLIWRRMKDQAITRAGGI